MKKQAQVLSCAIFLAIAAAGFAGAAPADPREHDGTRPYYAAAVQGNADAQAKLGALYLKGAGAPQSDALALQWFLRAAEQNHAEAQLSLSTLFSNGQGVARHDVLAYKWASLAQANALDADLRRRASDMLSELTRRMSERDVAEARKLARTSALTPEPEQPAKFELAAKKTAPAEPSRAEPSRAETFAAESRKAIAESEQPAAESRQPSSEAREPSEPRKPETETADQPTRAPTITRPDRRPSRLARIREELEMAHRTLPLFRIGGWEF